ncbi:uncharacterized protein LOC125380687 [Haliotis rufescens]|uniref:uncharacterized protein LOC125380687 n=1 Tax=Haliotis rufescens TaxID=6454 RepID=UPI00201F7529|nr:uncharacterized protein LOC125380687 [Haliotis rufescens]
MNKLLGSIYENIKVCVRNNNEISETFISQLGVRQGCILSPFFFTFFINELAVQINTNCNYGVQLHPDITKIFLLLFADDIVFFSSTIKGLQCQINELESYCNKWKLTVNMSKTKVLVFKNGGHLASKEYWSFKGQKIETTGFYKYLGVYFSRNLSWHKHLYQAALQARKVFVSIHKSLKVLETISHQSFLKIFDIKILPILLYGAEVWGLHNFDAIERIHLYVCKKYLGVKINTSSLVVYGECGRFPLYVYSNIKVIKYWLRLIDMPSYRLPKKCYNMMIVYDNNGKRNWVTGVRELLFSCGFGDIWQNQNVYPKPMFILSLTQRLKDIYLQSWTASLTQTNKCFYYKLFKAEIIMEDYLSKVNVKKFRTALSRFRCSSHNLLIETGRYVNIPREERICNLCSLNSVEDEFHFLLVCPVYLHLREKYLQAYYYRYPNIIKFVTLLSNTKRSILQNVSMYIYYASLYRQNLMKE